MKLSEAIVLGAGLIRFDPGIYLGGGCGCLIGMGAAAIDKKDRLVVEGEFAFPEYPWLSEKFPAPAGLLYMTAGTPWPAYMIIGQMARQIKLETYAFEQALAWIRSVEPEEVEQMPPHVEVWLAAPVEDDRG
jgi:hypothetical protein